MLKIVKGAIWLCNHLEQLTIIVRGALIKRYGGDTPVPPGPQQSVDWDLVPFSFQTDWYQEVNLTEASLARSSITPPKVCSVSGKKERPYGEYPLY